MSKDIKRAAEVVSSLFSALDGNRLREANEFFGNWRALVGEKIAAHSRVVDVDRGIVVVEVDHPGWSQQLSFVKKRVISDLARAFPALAIRGMVVRVRQENAGDYRRQETVVGAGIPRATPEAGEDECDEDLRDTGREEASGAGIPLDSPLQDVLDRLRESIRKGKPKAK